MKINFLITNTILVAVLTITSITRAKDATYPTRVRVSGSGSSLETNSGSNSGIVLILGLGTTMTGIVKHQVPLQVIGWLVIAGGTMANKGSKARAEDLDLSAAKVWQAIVAESKMIDANPSLATPDAPISSAAAEFGLSPAEVAKLAIRIDEEVYSAVEKNEKINIVNLKHKLFPNGFQAESQKSAFQNMLALATLN